MTWWKTRPPNIIEIALIVALVLTLLAWGILS
jgi:hypothetical protein